MSNLERINAEQRLYVIKAGDDGYTCLGFDVCAKWSRAIAAFVGDYEKTPEPGTESAYHAYERLCERGRDHAAKTGKRCTAELTPALIGLEGNRVEVTYPDGETKRFIVGKSAGWMPCHLEIPNKRSTGGGPVYFPEGSIVRVLGPGRN